MNRRYLILVVIIIASAAAVAIWLLTRSGGVGETVTVERGDIDVTIEAVGRVEVLDDVLLLSPLTTTAEIVAVETGDQVSEGDVLVKLDQTPFLENVEAARAALFEAETNLTLLDSDVGSGAQALAERVEAQRRVREAEARLDQAEMSIAQSLILAPHDATVLAVNVRDGQDVGQNTELAQIARLEEFEVTLNIDEVDLPLVDRGAEARLVLEAFPEHEIESEIDAIALRGELVGGTTVFSATVRFAAQDDLLILPGMNAEVEITTDVREDVLLLPERALQTVGRRTFVDVAVDGEVERREIRTGVRSDGRVEIASGLNEGDEVVIP